MRSDEEMEAMETGEDRAIVAALRSGAAPAPEFAARLKQSFLAEAQSDAHRRKAYSLSILGLPKFYINLAAAGAAAALILMAITYNSWLKPTPTLEIAESVSESAAGVRGVVLGLESGAIGFAPHAGDRKDAVDAVSSSLFTPEVPGILEQIAAEAGGAAAELLSKGNGTNEDGSDVESIVMTVPSDVLDHVLDRLDEAIGLAEITKPVHLNSEEVAVYITFNPD